MNFSSLCLNRFVLVVAVFGLLGSGARAQSSPEISFVTLYHTAAYNQTGNGNTLTSLGSYFNASLTAAQPNDFNTVQMSYPGAVAPANLLQQSPSYYFFSSGTFPNQTAMDASYPTGIYQFNASGTTGSDSTSTNYLINDYPGSVPYLTGSDFTNLQGMNASTSFNFHFSPFVTGSQATDSFLFFTLFDNTTSTLVYDAGFQPATTTGLTLAANTLNASHSYSYELIYSNRDSVPSPGANFKAVLGFDRRTTGQFSTAATTSPEPSTLALLTLGSLGIVACRRKVGLRCK